MDDDESRPTTEPAGGTSASEAAPAPQPTSRTEPPAGSDSKASWRDGVSTGTRGGATAAGSIAHGSSGAWNRTSSGMIQPSSSSAQRLAALSIRRHVTPARAEGAGYGTLSHVGTRILTVEDDERIRTAVKMALEDEGWTV